MKPIKAFITAIALIASIAHADVVVTKDGSSINGKVLGIENGKITIATDFAGKIQIDQAQVASLSTDEPVYLTLDSGTTYLGPVEGDANGITIKSTDGNLSTNLTKVTESWKPGEKSPTATKKEAEIAKLQRHWAYEAAFDLTGKSGNKSSSGLAASFRARLKGPDDKLEFFARTNLEETGSVKSADDARGGVDYLNRFGTNYNWYVRTEAGRDAVKDIDVLFTTAAGFGYIFSDNEARELSIRGGIGYLFESYGDPSRMETSSASLDLGLAHKETFDWGTWVNRVTFTPTLNDFGNYRFNYDTSFDIPLKTEFWSTRIGVSNTYDSEASLSGKEELDTTYYVRMVLKWR